MKISGISSDNNSQALLLLLWFATYHYNWTKCYISIKDWTKWSFVFVCLFLTKLTAPWIPSWLKTSVSTAWSWESAFRTSFPSASAYHGAMVSTGRTGDLRGVPWGVSGSHFPCAKFPLIPPRGLQGYYTTIDLGSEIFQKSLLTSSSLWYLLLTPERRSWAMESQRKASTIHPEILQTLETPWACLQRRYRPCKSAKTHASDLRGCQEQIKELGC